MGAIEILGSVGMWMVWGFEVCEVWRVWGLLIYGSPRECELYPQTLDLDKL